MAVQKKKSTVNAAGNYTKPALRKRIFNRIKAGGKGGAPGQWSARKAQMVASAYKKAGGGYRGYWAKSGLQSIKSLQIAKIQKVLVKEHIVKEGRRKKLSIRRIPRKKGQPAKSKKHSDLYTDEDPKGTIKGLKFATQADAKRSVQIIKKSGRSHAHKIQAAIAMEQRAKVAGKNSSAIEYRKFINSMKKKTQQRKRA